MKNILGLIVCLLGTFFSAQAEFIVDSRSYLPKWKLDDHIVVSAPDEGLWAISLGWEKQWMTDWHYVSPDKMDKSGEWTNVSGSLKLDKGNLFLRDSYREVKPGLIQCRRRFEWNGKETLHRVNLSVRLRVQGDTMQTFMPGILYYGNKNGARINAQAVPVYGAKPGEFAIFEDHRFPMPFAMLENKDDKFAVAIHTTPSPVRGAAVADQWWSMGVEAANGYTDFVLYSGPIGYNGKHAVAKALQGSPMDYQNTYLDLEPRRVIEKEFYIELYKIDGEGTGFQQPIYTALDLYHPYNAENYTDFETIVKEKYRFAQSRWIDFGKGAAGFDMYDTKALKELVMGWCGQADSPGYSLQLLRKLLHEDETIDTQIQTSLDFLSTYPVNEETGLFPVVYNGKKFLGGGDNVSCGQAMYNFSKAIMAAKKKRRYDTDLWKKFLKKCCDGQTRRILSDQWNPRSTAEAFYIAPLALSSKIFRNKEYRKAAEKAAQTFADRHLKMNGCYWGGTLDASCEDKEGAWAAFQGFLTMYEVYKDKKYLNWAKHAMDVCLSYVVVWDIPLPAGRMADYHFSTKGWTVVSPQNQHIDVYGVLFAPEVYKMGTYLKDERLHKLSKVMYRSCFQLTNAYGSQGEQLQHTNFAQNGDMSNVYKLRGGYSEGWTVFWITAHFLNAAARFVEMGVEP